MCELPIPRHVHAPGHFILRHPDGTVHVVTPDRTDADSPVDRAHKRVRPELEAFKERAQRWTHEFSAFEFNLLRNEIEWILEELP
jgi:hypothetical protein